MTGTDSRAYAADWAEAADPAHYEGNDMTIYTPEALAAMTKKATSAKILDKWSSEIGGLAAVNFTKGDKAPVKVVHQFDYHNDDKG